MTSELRHIRVSLDFSVSSKRVARATARNVVAAGAVIAAMLLAPRVAAAQEMVQSRQTTPGRTVYQTYCASCHGTTARGDGPLAANMITKPSNLTEMARRNAGVFPSELVFKTIDGRLPIRGHGGPDMPVWGDAFSRTRDAADAARVKAVIQSLVDYLESIQLRLAHEQ